jgi:uncharacterized phage-associated protein
MVYLGRHSEPLVPGNFEAWDYGPVHPVLYCRAKVFGANPVGNVFHDVAAVPAGPARDVLNEAYDALGNAGPGRLVNATHRRGGAWDRHYVPGARHCIIPNADILAEYQGLPNAA